MKARAQKSGELRFRSILKRSGNKLWESHFQVPNDVAERFIHGNSRRVVCRLGNSSAYQCALRPYGQGVFVIPVNKTMRDRLGLEFGTAVEVSLRKDESEYGLPFPEELRELLQQDPEGSRLFHALTRGRQRTLLYVVGSAKSSDKRISRAIAVIKHLKSNGGKINYKELYGSLKNSHR